MKYIFLAIFSCTIQLQVLGQSKSSKGATKTSNKSTTNVVAKKTSKVATTPKPKVETKKTSIVTSKTKAASATKPAHGIVTKSSVQVKKGIHWLSLEEAQEQMKLSPKKVYIDIYTDWCGWCKQMDTKVFTNKNVIEYINENYYAVHLNAETADSLLFKGKKYGRIEESKTNSLAATFMNNKLTYPTSIFFDEDFLNPQPVPGYLEIPVMEMILKYIGTNKHKSVPFEKYKKEFKATWGD